MPLPFDPQTLAVVGIDDHLPPVPPPALEAEALRRRFAEPPAWTPEIRNEHRIGERTPAHASVLVALVPRAAGLTVLLTQRTDHLTDHPGQISFPGGRVESFDLDAAATALREAHEEIGLEREFVDVLGAMPTCTTGTGFIVTPIVALVRPGFSVRADPSEVAEVFEVPLDFLMDPRHHRRHAVELGEGGSRVRREFYSMPWETRDGDAPSRRYFIWGATAAMLRNLYRFLAA